MKTNHPEIEVWLPVRGWASTYEVSNLGRIRRALYAQICNGTVPGRILKPTLTSGYMVVSLSSENTAQTCRLHCLVLSAFCGEKPFPGAQAAHNDGDTSNCKLTNLRWATPVENQADVDRHDRRCKGENVHSAVLKEADVRRIRERIADGEKNGSLASDYGVTRAMIHRIRHNQSWKHVV